MNLPSIKPTPLPPPHPPIPTTTPTTNTTAVRGGDCSNCNIPDRWVIHHVILRGGANRELCTSCVLRLHPSSFCPTCLEFFDHPLSSAHRFISCTKCSSLTHLRCLPPSSPPPSSFLCPSCSNPAFRFFNPDNALRMLDKRHTLLALCAAKIAFASVAKALNIARARSDRTVREAASFRKKAREALERVYKLHRAEGSIDVSGSRNLGTNNNDNQGVVVKKEEVNGQIKVRVSSVALPSPVAVSNNGAPPRSVVRGNVNVNVNGVVKDNAGNGEDSERVKSVANGRVVDVS